MIPGPGTAGLFSRVTGMLRQVGCAAFALLLLGGTLRAEDFKGKVTRVEPQQMLLSVSVNGQERTYKVANNAKFVDDVGRTLNDGIGSKHLREGVEVLLTTEPKGADEVVTRVTVRK
jgi:hypothetical protein